VRPATSREVAFRTTLPLKIFKMADKINRKHEKGIIEAIKNNPIFTFNDIFVYYKGCSRTTAYEHNLNKSDTIRENLYENKRKGVVSMLSKWIKSDNPTLQIAAMRIISDDDERQRLNQQYVEHSGQIDTKVIRPKREA